MSTSECRKNGARSHPSAAIRAARRAGSRLHLASVLREGRKSANIHASLGRIWGIPDNPFECASFIQATSALVHHGGHFH